VGWGIDFRAGSREECGVYQSLGGAMELMVRHKSVGISANHHLYAGGLEVLRK